MLITRKKYKELIIENQYLAETCQRQGESIFKKEKIINDYSNKLTNILEIIQTNNYNNTELQIQRIRKEILK